MSRIHVYSSQLLNLERVIGNDNLFFNHFGKAVLAHPQVPMCLLLRDLQYQHSILADHGFEDPMLVFPFLLKIFSLLMIRQEHVTGDLLEPLYVHLVVYPIDLEG